MPQTEWHARLKRTVPVAEIPSYLGELQALVAALRRWRDDLKVPTAEQVRPLLGPRLVEQARLTVDYLDDARYRTVVEEALASLAPDGSAEGDQQDERAP